MCVCVCVYSATSLTANVTEDVGANVGENEHRDGQSAVWQNLPHFCMQERTAHTDCVKTYLTQL